MIKWRVERHGEGKKNNSVVDGDSGRGDGNGSQAAERLMMQRMETSERLKEGWSERIIRWKREREGKDR